jgi:hypothetical protein
MVQNIKKKLIQRGLAEKLITNSIINFPCSITDSAMVKVLVGNQIEMKFATSSIGSSGGKNYLNINPDFLTGNSGHEGDNIVGKRSGQNSAKNEMSSH